ncbi:MAG: hypothetical protein AAGB46_02370, partial [Verrucomicrobiota bacterium]
IIAEGLAAPAGITTNSSRTLYFSEVPTPDLSGDEGGENTVKKLDLRSGNMTTLSEGEPYPLNLALDRYGNVYWTCNTAGVILKYSRRGGEKSVFLPQGLVPGESDPEGFEFLMKPSGITVDRAGDVLWTEVPNPGNFDGGNLVNVADKDGNISLSPISEFEPAPTDIVISWDGSAYWTCNTAGVIVRRSPGGVVSIFKGGLEYPTGIALNRLGTKLYYTEIPTPGLFGPGFPVEDQGGRNKVVELDLKTGETHTVAYGYPLPQDVAVAPNGNIYWTCSTAGVIACAKPQQEKRRYYWRW